MKKFEALVKKIDELDNQIVDFDQEDLDGVLALFDQRQTLADQLGAIAADEPETEIPTEPKPDEPKPDRDVKINPRSLYKRKP